MRVERTTLRQLLKKCYDKAEWPQANAIGKINTAKLCLATYSFYKWNGKAEKLEKRLENMEGAKMEIALAKKKVIETKALLAKARMELSVRKICNNAAARMDGEGDIEGAKVLREESTKNEIVRDLITQNYGCRSDLRFDHGAALVAAAANAGALLLADARTIAGVAFISVFMTATFYGQTFFKFGYSVVASLLGQLQKKDGHGKSKELSFSN